MQTVEMAALRLEDVSDGDTFGSGPVQARLTPRRTALLVAAGGAIGALLRFVLMVISPTVATPTLVELPWATLWANVLGCLILGTLTGVLEVRPGRPWMLPLLGTGLCGGFTTMSTVVLEGSAMIGADFPMQAFAYALATVFGCLGAMVGGLLGGRRLAHRAAARSDRAGRGASRTDRVGTSSELADSDSSQPDSDVEQAGSDSHRGGSDPEPAGSDPDPAGPDTEQRPARDQGEES
ncbi:hypothetical protein GCM10009626_19700 [Brachybacterium sacelli]